MGSQKLDELARKKETEYLSTLGNIHWILYPFIKTLRRIAEIVCCSKNNDPFMDEAMDELNALHED